MLLMLLVIIIVKSVTHLTSTLMMIETERKFLSFTDPTVAN